MLRFVIICDSFFDSRKKYKQNIHDKNFIKKLEMYTFTDKSLITI